MNSPRNESVGTAVSTKAHKALRLYAGTCGKSVSDIIFGWIEQNLDNTIEWYDIQQQRLKSSGNSDCGG